MAYAFTNTAHNEKKLVEIYIVRIYRDTTAPGKLKNLHGVIEVAGDVTGELAGKATNHYFSKIDDLSTIIQQLNQAKNIMPDTDGKPGRDFRL